MKSNIRLNENRIRVWGSHEIDSTSGINSISLLAGLPYTRVLQTNHHPVDKKVEQTRERTN